MLANLDDCSELRKKLIQWEVKICKCSWEINLDDFLSSYYMFNPGKNKKRTTPFVKMVQVICKPGRDSKEWKRKNIITKQLDYAY